MRSVPATLLVALLAISCTAPEDRRWAAAPRHIRTGDVAAALTDVGASPGLNIYSFPTPAGAPAQTGLKDLSDRGQAAVIESLRSVRVKAADLRKSLSEMSGAGAADASTTDRTRLERSIVINVSKGFEALPGDRLMYTVVLVRPLDRVFRFADYKIAATDTKVQNIAHIDDKLESSAAAELKPGAGSLRGGDVSGKVTRTAEAAADITQQYENLGVDITPDLLRVTRESERGLDVVGNTIVAVTLAPPDSALAAAAYLGSSPRMFEAARPLRAAKASLDISPLSYLAACPVRAEARLVYRLRRIDAGREFYTEGRQRVTLEDGATPWLPYTLVDASQAQPELYQLIINSGPRAGQAVEAVTPGGGQRPLLFTDRSAAGDVAEWMSRSRATQVGKDRTPLTGGGDPLVYPTTISPRRASLKCPEHLGPPSGPEQGVHPPVQSAG